MNKIVEFSAGIEYSINTWKNLLEWHYVNGITILDFFYQKWATT